MRPGSHGDCLICRLEERLVSEFRETDAWQDLGIARDSGTIFSCFETPLDLVRTLHAVARATATPSSDDLLGEVLRQNAPAPAGSGWQRLLLLVFIPTIHRTASQVRAAFRPLGRDDVSQHVVVLFLELLSSLPAGTLRSHVAFHVARQLRRRVFRWAIQEARLALPEENAPGLRDEPIDPDSLGTEIALERFLDHCERAGWLSGEERRLLVEFKLEGVSCRALAARNGHSAVAIQHRLQRILDRLRRIAEKAPSHQFELFAREECGKKNFAGTRSISFFAGRLVE